MIVSFTLLLGISFSFGSYASSSYNSIGSIEFETENGIVNFDSSDFYDLDTELVNITNGYNSVITKIQNNKADELSAVANKVNALSNTVYGRFGIDESQYPNTMLDTSGGVTSVDIQNKVSSLNGFVQGGVGTNPAGPSKVLEGYTYIGGSGTKSSIGTMPYNTPITVELTSEQVYNIPLGYHTGSGIIKAPKVVSLKDQTSDATAGAGDILSGETAYVNGSLVTGTMPNKGAVSKELSAGGSYTIPAGYHNGQGKVTAKSLASQTDGDAVAANILSGKTAYVDGSKVTGTMINKGGSTTSATTVTESGDNALISIPANGYYTTGSKISVPIETLKEEVSSLNSSITIKSYTFSRPSGSGSTNMILDVTNYKKLSIGSITYNDKGRLVITGDVSGTLYTIERSGSGTVTYNKKLDISKDNIITISPTQHSSGDHNNTLTVNNIVIGN